MSALPVEQHPSGVIPADTDRGSRGPRPRLAGRPARRDVHPLFPGKRAVLPDGDCVFPGGGERFSGASQSYARRSSRPVPAGCSSARSLTSIQQVTGTAPAAGAGADRIARAVPPARPVPARPVPARPVPARSVPGRSVPARLGRPVLAGRPVSAAPGGGGHPLPADPAHQARPDRRGGAGRRGGLRAVRGGGQRGPGQQPGGGPRGDRIRPADHRPAGQHAVVHRRERRPARRRPDRRPGNAAGQSAQDCRHHGRAAPMGAARLAAAPAGTAARPSTSSLAPERARGAGAGAGAGCGCRDTPSGVRFPYVVSASGHTRRDTCGDRLWWSTVTTTSSSYTNVFYPELVSRRGCLTDAGEEVRSRALSLLQAPGQPGDRQPHRR